METVLANIPGRALRTWYITTMTPLPPELERLGLGRYAAHKPDALPDDLATLARVTAEHKGAYDVAGIWGEGRAAVPAKWVAAAKGRDDFPAVGDWIVLEPGEIAAAEPRLIARLLPRVSTLHKRYGGAEQTQLMAANVEVAFIVEAMDRDYSLNRFERYVVIAREGGVEPVLVLNKADLLTADELAARVAELHSRFDGVRVLTTSSVSEGGLASLEDAIKPGITGALLGSSGAGKSTIINRLLDAEAIKTQTVSASTGRGKHTTTGRRLHILPGGGLIIDNPGSREVGITDAAAGIQEAFDDIEALALRCRFSNCSHTSETGCAVLAALEAGEFEAGHYHNYLKMVKEAEHFAATEYERRQKDKKFGRMAKQILADSDKY